MSRAPEVTAAAAARREQVFDLIAESINGRGYPPTVRELMASTGVPSSITIRRDLAHLAQAKRIEVDAGEHRGIRLAL